LVPIYSFGTFFDFESRFYKSETPVYYNRLILQDPFRFDISFINSNGGWEVTNFSLRSDTLFVDSNKLFFHVGNIGFTPNVRLIGNVDNIVGFKLNDIPQNRSISFGAFYKNSIFHPTSLFMGGWYDAYNAKIYYKLSTEGLFSTEIGIYKEFVGKNYNINYIAFFNPTFDSVPYVSPGTGIKFGYSNDFFSIGGASQIYAWRYKFLYDNYPDGFSFLSVYLNIHSNSYYYLSGGINFNRDFKNFLTLSHYINQNIKLTKRSYLNTSVRYYMSRIYDHDYSFEEYDLTNHYVHNFDFFNISADMYTCYKNNYFKNNVGISFFINYQRIFGRYSVGYINDPSPIIGEKGAYNNFFLSWNYSNYGISAEFNTVNSSLSKFYIGGRLGHGRTVLEGGYSWNNSIKTFNLSFGTGGNIEEISANILIGKVYFDKNSNRIYDSGDEGIDGISIFLDGKLRGKSDKNGDFKIYFVPGGSHTISLGYGSMPAFIGTKRSLLNIVMPKFGSLKIDMPFFKLSSISGKVFYDDNGNGFYDKGEKGVPNVLVEAGEKWTVTDEYGDYTLANLLPGEYLVVPKLIPEGYRLSLYNLRMFILLKQGDNAKDISFGITKQSKNVIMKEF